MKKLIDHGRPFCKVRGLVFKVKSFTYIICKMLIFKSDRSSIYCWKIEVLYNVLSRNIAEESNLISYILIKLLFCTANYDIRLDSKSHKVTYTCLSWLGLKLLRSCKIRNKCYVDEYGILMSYFMLELSDRLYERLAFDISDCTTYFDDSYMHIIRNVISVEAALNFVCDVRDYLYCTTAVISTTLL